jgi:hypothetical protein
VASKVAIDTKNRSGRVAAGLPHGRSVLAWRTKGSRNAIAELATYGMFSQSGDPCSGQLAFQSGALVLPFNRYGFFAPPARLEGRGALARETARCFTGTQLKRAVTPSNIGWFRAVPNAFPEGG